MQQVAVHAGEGEEQCDSAALSLQPVCALTNAFCDRAGAEEGLLMVKPTSARGPDSQGRA
jgi:hypothetical protein